MKTLVSSYWWGCEISRAVTHGGRSRGGLLAVHPNPSSRLGPAEMLHREQDRHPIKQDKGLCSLPGLPPNLVDYAATVIPAGSRPIDQNKSINPGLTSERFMRIQWLRCLETFYFYASCRFVIFHVVSEVAN